MFLFALLTYVQRSTLSVAAARIMPQFNLSQMQLGWMMWAFSAAYTALQIPAGILGEKIGPRATFAALGIVSSVALGAIPLAPLLLSGTALFVVWLLAQALLGAAHAPVTPVANGVFEAWFPVQRWGFVVGLSSSGPNLGVALTPPLVVALSAAVGWRSAVLAAALPTALLAVLWFRYARNTPAEHPSITPAELRELGPIARQRRPPLTLRRFARIFLDRNVLLLSASYFCLNYVFWMLTDWSFLYLIQERHMTNIESGVLAALPPIGAALGAWIGGHYADGLAQRFGPRWGYRLVPMIALPCVAVLLLSSLHASGAYTAIGALSLAAAGVELTEGSFWAAMMLVARTDTMAASGVLNMLGNLGGVVGIPVVAWLTGHGSWLGAFAIGSACALIGAGLWLLIRADQQLELAPVDCALAVA